MSETITTILPIVEPIAIIVIGYIVTFISTRVNIANKISTVIAKTERKYEKTKKEYTSSEKLDYAVNLLYGYVPAFIKPFVSKDTLKSSIQLAFEEIEEYANIQLDKVVNKIETTLPDEVSTAATSEKETTE